MSARVSAGDLRIDSTADPGHPASLCEVGQVDIDVVISLHGTPGVPESGHYVVDGQLSTGVLRLSIGSIDADHPHRHLSLAADRPVMWQWTSVCNLAAANPPINRPMELFRGVLARATFGSVLEIVIHQQTCLANRNPLRDLESFERPERLPAVSNTRLLHRPSEVVLGGVAYREADAIACEGSRLQGKVEAIFGPRNEPYDRSDCEHERTVGRRSAGSISVKHRAVGGASGAA
jgi:hypothetical protein